MSVKKCKAALVTDELDGALVTDELDGALVSTTPSASIVEDTIDGALDATALVPSPAASWNEWVDAYGYGYQIPEPTDTSGSFLTGDDAWIDANIYTQEVRQAETLKARNTLTDFYTLQFPNVFGNNLRFFGS